MYATFAKEAKEEGLDDIAALFEMVAKVEKEHEERFLKLAQNLKDNKVFEKDEETVWVCRNCGYVHVGKKAPGICPACKHAQAYFEVKAENY